MERSSLNLVLGRPCSIEVDISITDRLNDLLNPSPSEYRKSSGPSANSSSCSSSMVSFTDSQPLNFSQLIFNVITLCVGYNGGIVEFSLGFYLQFSPLREREPPATPSTDLSIKSESDIKVYLRYATLIMTCLVPEIQYLKLCSSIMNGS